MTDESAFSPDGPPSVVLADDASPEEAHGAEDAITSPAKVLRIGAMTKQLLDEVRHAPLDEAGRARLKEIYETSVHELGECLSDDLRPEVAARLGDVAVVARAPIAFDDPADTGSYRLQCRHGSLTSAEMLVPLLGARP